MKKYLLTLAAMLFCVTSHVMAEKKPLIIIVDIPPIQPQSPQAGSFPLVRGEYDSEELTLYIEDYDGEATISIIDVTSQQIVYSEDEIFVSPAIINIDLSNLPSSTYYVLIELDNGCSYYATIRI